MSQHEKEALILALLDGEIQEADFRVLQELLLNDSETLELYHELIMVEQLLEKSYSVKLRSLNEFQKHLRMDSKAVLAAAACLIALLVATVLIKVSEPEPVALLRFSENSSFTYSGTLKDNQLELGEDLEIEYGALELSLPRDVVGIVSGPAKIRLVDEQTLQLSRGRATFEVSEKGQGFEVLTSRLTAKDLGTQFTVISGWGRKDEVHVKEGEVLVSSHLGHAKSVLGGKAISVSSEGMSQMIAYSASHFQEKLPARVRPLFVDDFEGIPTPDGITIKRRPLGWHKVKTYKNKCRVFNPVGDGTFYSLPELNDNSLQEGVVEGMKGASLSSIYSHGRRGIRRVIGQIEAHKIYTVNITLGVRSSQDIDYAGYEVLLMNERTVLAGSRSIEPPCAPNSFTRISFSWDSDDLPEGAQVGDPLRIEILTSPTAKDKAGYVDFDNLEIFELTKTKM